MAIPDSERLTMLKAALDYDQLDDADDNGRSTFVHALADAWDDPSVPYQVWDAAGTLISNSDG